MASIPDKANRRELCEIICAQKEKLQRYEARLGDLVRAYKGLQKEKDALETSLNALTSRKPAENVSVTSDGASRKDGSHGVGAASEVPREGSEGAGGASGGCQEKRMDALSQALSTLSQEKARVEAAFQGDRRRLIQEKEAALQQVEEVQHAMALQVSTLEAKLSEVRGKLRDEQMEREKEQSDHAAMLRELQRLLSEERSHRDVLQDKLEEALRKAAQADLAKEYEAKVERLTMELEEVRRRLLTSEEKLRQPSPLLLQLQQELVQVKSQHQTALEQEQERFGHAQARLQQQTSGSEARVASLESRLQELSQAVGSYDRLRLQDRAALQRLRERLAQLAQENTALTKAAAAKATELPSQDSNLDVNTLLERFNKLRLLLKESNQRSQRPVDLMAYFRELAEEEVLGLHSKCHEEQRQLKDEFERYKAHAHLVIQGSPTSLPQEQEYALELERLRQQVKEFQAQLRVQRLRHEAQEDASRKSVLQLQHALSEAELRHGQERQRLEGVWSSKLSELESLMQAQRERSLALVEEKDRELQALREAGRSMGRDTPWQLPQRRDGGNGDLEGLAEVVASTEAGEFADPLLSQLLSGGPGQSFQGGRSKVECQLLHYAQELARKDAQLMRTVREKRDAETALRDLQRSILVREQKDAQEREALRLRLSQLENVPGSADGGKVNLQYLKNVVLQYLLCDEAPSRKHMLNAIAVGLRFTPQEAQLARQASQAWW